MVARDSDSAPTQFGPSWTGCVIRFDWATAVGFNVARPQAISSGKREKSTMHPSRL